MDNIRCVYVMFIVTCSGPFDLLSTKGNALNYYYVEQKADKGNIVTHSKMRLKEKGMARDLNNLLLFRLNLCLFPNSFYFRLITQENVTI